MHGKEHSRCKFDTFLPSAAADCEPLIADTITSYVTSRHDILRKSSLLSYPVQYHTSLRPQWLAGCIGSHGI
jgi:hypothetical protein